MDELRYRLLTEVIKVLGFEHKNTIAFAKIVSNRKNSLHTCEVAKKAIIELYLEELVEEQLED